VEREGRGKRKGRKGKGVGRETRWMEGFGPPKNFGVAPLGPMYGRPIGFWEIWIGY